MPVAGHRFESGRCFRAILCSLFHSTSRSRYSYSIAASAGGLRTSQVGRLGKPDCLCPAPHAGLQCRKSFSVAFASNRLLRFSLPP